MYIVQLEASELVLEQGALDNSILKMSEKSIVNRMVNLRSDEYFFIYWLGELRTCYMSQELSGVRTRYHSVWHVIAHHEDEQRGFRNDL